MMPVPGMLFKGYCQGYFGRDGCYGARVEAFGADWIVARKPNGETLFARFGSTAEMVTKVAQFSQEKSPEEEQGFDE